MANNPEERDNTTLGNGPNRLGSVNIYLSGNSSWQEKKFQNGR